MQVVRSWLSCRAAYLEVMPTFRKRRLIAEGKRDAKDLSKEEYASIEKMDKFLNFLLRIVTVNPAFAGQQNLWNWLYADYWLEQLYEEELSELMWYTREFYPDFPRSVSRTRSACISVVGWASAR